MMVQILFTCISMADSVQEYYTDLKGQFSMKGKMSRKWIWGEVESLLLPRCRDSGALICFETRKVEGGTFLQSAVKFLCLDASLWQKFNLWYGICINSK